MLEGSGAQIENSSLIVVSGLRTRHQITVIIIYAVDCGESTARCIDLGNRPLKYFIILQRLRTMRKYILTIILSLLPLLTLAQNRLETLESKLEMIENTLLSKKTEYQRTCLEYENARKNTAEKKQEYETAKGNYERASKNVDLISAADMFKILNEYKLADQAFKDAKEQEKSLEINKTKLFNDVKEFENQIKSTKIDILKYKADKFDEEMTKPIWSEGYGESVLDENKTILECKKLALDYARRDAMEKGGKVLIESITEIRDFRIYQDELKSQAKVQIIDQDNSGGYGEVKQEIVGNVMKFSVKIRVKLQSASKYNPFKAQIAELQGEKISYPEDTSYKYPDKTYDKPLKGMTFVTIPSGSFMMGSNEGGSDEKPVHNVNIKSFYLMKTEVTVGQFRQFVNETGYKTDAEKSGGAYVYEGTQWTNKSDANWRNPYFHQNDNHPVVCVSWNDCKEFIRWLNQKDAGKNYRLPTEAEWEYACGNGNRHTKYSWGDGNPAGKQGGNVADKSAKRVFLGWTIFDDYDDGFVYTAPAASFNANDFGLYDMTGNVWEWCEDWYHSSYGGSPTDGSAWLIPSSSSRILRGGSWSSNPSLCRSANRSRNDPGARVSGLGFRLARSL